MDTVELQRIRAEPLAQSNCGVGRAPRRPPCSHKAGGTSNARPTLQIQQIDDEPLTFRAGTDHEPLATRIGATHVRRKIQPSRPDEAVRRRRSRLLGLQLAERPGRPSRARQHARPRTASSCGWRAARATKTPSIMRPGTEQGGPFRQIQTDVNGIQISEHFPQLARLMNHAAIIRSMSTPEGAHARASYNMHTGYREGQGGIVYPTIGAIVSKELGSEDRRHAQLRLHRPGQVRFRLPRRSPSALDRQRPGPRRRKPPHRRQRRLNSIAASACSTSSNKASTRRTTPSSRSAPHHRAAGPSR